MNCFVGHNGPYYQRIIMGMLATFHVRVREGYGGKGPRYVFWEGSSYKLNQENSLFLIICSSQTLERVFGSEIKGI